MSSAKQIYNLFGQLFPTGRAWNFVRNSVEAEQFQDIYTDGNGDPYTDGNGDPYYTLGGSGKTEGQKIVAAELKAYERLYTDIFSILNITLPDNDEFSTTDASNWERVLALSNSALTLEERKQAISRKYGYPNGVSERATPNFIQDQLQAAGFDVYVYENRFADGSGGWETYDPEEAIYGSFNYGETTYGNPGVPDSTIIANYIDEDRDSLFAMGDETRAPFTFFICGENFLDVADVQEIRKDEFRELILKLKPCHSAGYLIVNYI